ncbi:MAG: glycohydrolase toxin TNT-related protein, partial [Actinophytocola sp.]|uniref:TNT domain-containing protein n=1 Tax=Actinophytocola sp. TaxID=1872138 RepID=UPI003C758650
RAAAFAPAAVPVDRPADAAPRANKPMAGPPGAPPPVKGERNEVLTAFWLHMFPIGHLPVASYRPARQIPAPPPELDYAAGIRFEPADHPDYHLVDGGPRLAELMEGIAHRAAAKAAEEAAPVPLPPPSTPPGFQSYAPPSAYQGQGYPAAPGYPAPGAYSPQVIGAESAGYPAPPAEALVAPDAVTPPQSRPVNPSAGITADHPIVQALLENHDPLGDVNERDWDRRYLVRLGSVTPQGISPEGLEYNWPTSEQYPEGGSAPGEAETLAEDTVIDRFGSPHGRVFAADGCGFAQRSLPPAHKDGGYRRYRVLKPLPVWRAVSAAWFGQPGGGVRYRTTHSAVELVALGHLEEIA